MAMAFDTDVLPLYSTKVSNDANYQSPGNFGLPATFIDDTAEQRVLTVIEVIRSYLATTGDHTELKNFHECISHLLATLPLGGGAPTFSASNIASAAQKAALREFGKNNRSTTL